MINEKFRKSISLHQDLGFYELNNPKSIFQEMYNKAKKNENKNIITTNKTEEFLNLIEQMRLNEEMVETDKEYIIKESRREVKFNQEMLYLFGRNRKNRRTTKKIAKIKLDKKIFLNPLEKKEKNRLFSKSKSNVNILKLPIITNKNHFLLKRKNPFKLKKIHFSSEGNKQNKHILSFNDSDNNSINDNSKKIININFTYRSQNNQKHKKTINSLLTTERSSRKSKKYESYKEKDKMRQKKIFSDINILNDIIVNKKIKKPLINLLDNINEELKIDKIKHKNYFQKNDYGCELSKFKINYLKKHYFQ